MNGRRWFALLLIGGLASLAADSPKQGTGEVPSRPVVVLMIGDGMGRGILDVASLFVAGRLGGLALQQLPVHTTVVTDSLDGLTDSAAAATTMACGVLTHDGRIAFDGNDLPCHTIVQTARERGLAVGVVTDDELFDATPAAFSAHVRSRGSSTTIVRQQVLETRLDVMFGGGSIPYAERGPEGSKGVPFVDSLRATGYTVVSNRVEMQAAVGAGGDKLWGLFAREELPWVAERAADAPEPTLTEMTMAAIAVLDRDPDGFLLVVEAGQIDKGAHQNHEKRAVHEVASFDRTVDAVARWARERPGALLLVTADHDTGYPRLVEDRGQGQIPRMFWTSYEHTRTKVDLFASGPGTEMLADAACDHRCVHQLIDARLRGERPILAGPVSKVGRPH